MKEVIFLGNSLENLRSFPDNARRDAGFEIDRLQRDLEPRDWKPMPSVGNGVREIRIREKSGIFRIVYAVKVAETVHILHTFQKKTQATAKSDIDLARQRFRHVMQQVLKDRKNDGS